METLGVPVRISTSMTSTIAAADGFPIAITTYAPAQRVRGVIVINAATGVRRRYYDPFATHLASQGFSVVTYEEHFGFFREAASERGWAIATEWLAGA